MRSFSPPWYPRLLPGCPALFLLLLFLAFLPSPPATTAAAVMNPAPPAAPVRLIFIHHSTGENWLSDENGGLGMALRDNNYFVSDTNYGWGPDSIGDSTDIGHWWLWFRGENSPAYLAALYEEVGQYASYSRLASPPGGENEIVMFKSCFPNSAFQGRPSDGVPPISVNPLRGEGSWSEYHTLANAKGIYQDLLNYFRTRQDKLFVAIAAPPLIDGTYGVNARAFNNWLVADWLRDYPYRNVAVFDFYNALTTNGGSAGVNDLGQASGNHHRWWNNTIQHKADVPSNTTAYPSDDDHPSRAGNLKATGEYLPLLNIFYHCWKGTGGCPAAGTGNPCAATLSPTLDLFVPALSFDDQVFFWVAFAYVPDSLNFMITNAGVIGDTFPFKACAPATLSKELSVHMPSILFGEASLWADFSYSHDLVFTLTGAGWK